MSGSGLKGRSARSTEGLTNGKAMSEMRNEKGCFGVLREQSSVRRPHVLLQNVLEGNEQKPRAKKSASTTKAMGRIANSNYQAKGIGLLTGEFKGTPDFRCEVGGKQTGTAVDWRRGLVDTLLNGSMPYSRGRTGEQVRFLPNQIGSGWIVFSRARCQRRRANTQRVQHGPKLIG